MRIPPLSLKPSEVRSLSTEIGISYLANGAGACQGHPPPEDNPRAHIILVYSMISMISMMIIIIIISSSSSSSIHTRARNGWTES